MNAKKQFSEWLRKKMEERGMNQADLCKASGILDGSISVYVRGLNLPEGTNMRKIAAALEVPPEEAFWAAQMGTPPVQEDVFLKTVALLLRGAGPELKSEVLEFIRMKRRLVERRSKGANHQG